MTDTFSLVLVLLYVTSGVIPIIIFFNSFNVLDIRIMRLRMFRSLPSLFTIIYDIAIGYLILNDNIIYSKDNIYINYLPLILSVLSIIIYFRKNKEESLIKADILKEQSIDIMDLRKSNNQERMELK